MFLLTLLIIVVFEQTLVELDLSSNAIEDIGAQQLFISLENNKVRL